MQTASEDRWAKYTDTEYRPTDESIGGICNRFHYRGFTHLSNSSTMWGDEIDSISHFVARTHELKAWVAGGKRGDLFGVWQHPCHGDEKGYKVPNGFMRDCDRMIAEAEENLATSDLSDEEKAEVVALWHSYGWYA